MPGIAYSWFLLDVFTYVFVRVDEVHDLPQVVINGNFVCALFFCASVSDNICGWVNTPKTAAYSEVPSHFF